MGRGDHLLRSGAFGTGRLGLLGADHHAVDLGDGTVVEFSVGRGTGAGFEEKARGNIVRRPVEDFRRRACLAGGHIAVRHYARPLPPDEVVRRALSQVGTDFGGYNLLTNNCETFATWCKTGERRSTQGDTAIRGATRGFARAALGRAPRAAEAAEGSALARGSSRSGAAQGAALSALGAAAATLASRYQSLARHGHTAALVASMTRGHLDWLLASRLPAASFARWLGEGAATAGSSSGTDASARYADARKALDAARGRTAARVARRLKQGRRSDKGGKPGAAAAGAGVEAEEEAEEAWLLAALTSPRRADKLDAVTRAHGLSQRAAVRGVARAAAEAAMATGAREATKGAMVRAGSEAAARRAGARAAGPAALAVSVAADAVPDVRAYAQQAITRHELALRGGGHATRAGAGAAGATAGFAAGMGSGPAAVVVAPLLSVVGALAGEWAGARAYDHAVLRWRQRQRRREARQRALRGAAWSEGDEKRGLGEDGWSDDLVAHAWHDAGGAAVGARGRRAYAEAGEGEEEEEEEEMESAATAAAAAAASAAVLAGHWSVYEGCRCTAPQQVQGSAADQIGSLVMLLSPAALSAYFADRGMPLPPPPTGQVEGEGEGKTEGKTGSEHGAAADGGGVVSADQVEVAEAAWRQQVHALAAVAAEGDGRCALDEAHVRSLPAPALHRLLADVGQPAAVGAGREELVERVLDGYSEGSVAREGTEEAVAQASLALLLGVAGGKEEEEEEEEEDPDSGPRPGSSVAARAVEVLAFTPAGAALCVGVPAEGGVAAEVAFLTADAAVGGMARGEVRGRIAVLETAVDAGTIGECADEAATGGGDSKGELDEVDPTASASSDGPAPSSRAGECKEEPAAESKVDPVPSSSGAAGESKVVEPAPVPASGPGPLTVDDEWAALPPLAQAWQAAAAGAAAVVLAVPTPAPAPQLSAAASPCPILTAAPDSDGEAAAVAGASRIRAERPFARAPLLTASAAAHALLGKAAAAETDTQQQEQPQQPQSEATPELVAAAGAAPALGTRAIRLGRLLRVVSRDRVARWLMACGAAPTTDDAGRCIRVLSDLGVFVRADAVASRAEAVLAAAARDSGAASAGMDGVTPAARSPPGVVDSLFCSADGVRGDDIARGAEPFPATGHRGSSAQARTAGGMWSALHRGVRRATHAARAVATTLLSDDVADVLCVAPLEHWHPDAARWRPWPWLEADGGAAGRRVCVPYAPADASISAELPAATPRDGRRGRDPAPGPQWGPWLAPGSGAVVMPSEAGAREGSVPAGVRLWAAAHTTPSVRLAVGLGDSAVPAPPTLPPLPVPCVSASGGALGGCADAFASGGSGGQARVARGGVLTAGCGLWVAPRPLAACRVSFAAVACGDSFTVARTAAGAVFAWGNASRGRLGLGRWVEEERVRSVARPTLLRGLADSRVACVRACDDHAFAVCASGRVAGWGGNSGGVLGCGPVDGGWDAWSPRFLAAFDPEAEHPRRAVGLSMSATAAAVWTAGGDVLVWGVRRPWTREPAVLAPGTEGGVGAGEAKASAAPAVTSLAVCGGALVVATEDGRAWLWGRVHASLLDAAGVDREQLSAGAASGEQEPPTPECDPTVQEEEEKDMRGSGATQRDDGGKERFVNRDEEGAGASPAAERKKQENEAEEEDPSTLAPSASGAASLKDWHAGVWKRASEGTAGLLGSSAGSSRAVVVARPHLIELPRAVEEVVGTAGGTAAVLRLGADAAGASVGEDMQRELWLGPRPLAPHPGGMPQVQRGDSLVSASWPGGRCGAAVTTGGRLLLWRGQARGGVASLFGEEARQIRPDTAGGAPSPRSEEPRFATCAVDSDRVVTTDQDGVCREWTAAGGWRTISWTSVVL